MPVEHGQLPAGQATPSRPGGLRGLQGLQRSGAGQSCALDGDHAVPGRTTQRGASAGLAGHLTGDPIRAPGFAMSGSNHPIGCSWNPKKHDGERTTEAHPSPICFPNVTPWYSEVKRKHFPSSCLDR